MSRVFTETLRLANLGTRDAQYQVGLMYANGVGVAQSLDKAIEWVSKAAQRGLPAAQYLLATRYANGVAVQQDERAALWWCMNAAEQGHLKAQYKLGQLLSRAHPDAAQRSLQVAAEQGLPEAQYALGQALADTAATAPQWRKVFAWYQRAARQGLPAAQCALADLYAQGRGVAQSQEEAIAWYRKAARQNFAKAQLALETLLPSRGRQTEGRRKPSAAERRQLADRWIQVADASDADGKYAVGQMYAFGLGVGPDLRVARTQYQAAARLGHARAQLALAELLEQAEPQAARGWYEKAAQAGLADAQHALARMLAHQADGLDDRLRALALQVQASQAGHATAQADLATALAEPGALRAALLQSAAEGRQPDAQFEWGCCLFAGTHVAQNRAHALVWWEQAALAGHVGAASALGAALLAQTDQADQAAKALQWLRSAAKAGDAKAQWNLGGMYVAGTGGLKADLNAAFDWCQQSADQGFVPAQATLGILFERAGQHALALQWLTLAAKAGDPEAQHNLALMLRSGKGGAVDLAGAFEWLLRAADQGVANAQARLGVAFGAGEGVAADPIEAHKWLLLAADRGEALAKANLAFSQSQMSPAQLKEAARRAQYWRAQTVKPAEM